MKKNALLVRSNHHRPRGSNACCRERLTLVAPASSGQFAEEPLYVSAPTARRLSLAFNGLAADWYWMRSLQYVGGKIVAYQDSHDGRVDFGNLGSLNLGLLTQLLHSVHGARSAIHGALRIWRDDLAGSRIQTRRSLC